MEKGALAELPKAKTCLISAQYKYKTHIMKTQRHLISNWCPLLEGMLEVDVATKHGEGLPEGHVQERQEVFVVGVVVVRTVGSDCHVEGNGPTWR